MTPGEQTIELDVQVPELLERFPQTRRVLDRYGLHGCGGAHGPAESLRFFARAHEVDELTLLTELNQAASRPLDELEISPDVMPRVDDTIYRRFFLTAIAVTLIAGAAWGTWMLWQIGVARSFIGISIFEINAHGHAQIFGWVGLFIMGFAYQAFPRFWRTRLAMPPLAVAVFVAMLVGLIVKTAALPLAGSSSAAIAAAVGGALELAAVAVFVWQIESTFAGSAAPLEPWVGFVFVSLTFFLAQAAMSLWHGWMTMTAPNQQQVVWYVSTYQSPLRDLQFHGMAMLMIVGVCLRMVPGLYVVPKVAHRRAWTALGLLTTAVIAEVVLFITYRWTGDELFAGLLLVPRAMLIVGVAMAVLPWKLWRPLRDIDGQTDRTGKFVRAGYGWLMVSLVMLLLLPLYNYLSGIPFSHAYYGASNHAIAVGFISLMIMGFAAKVVPTLNGVDPRKLSALWGPFILINVGCFLRVSLQTLTDSHPALFPLVGISGVLELTALAWWGWGLAAVIQRGRRADEAVPESLGGAPIKIAAGHRVADVLRWFPNSEAVFVHHGFAAVCNPVLRRTVARQVSIHQAAAMQGVNLEQLLVDLNKAAGNGCACGEKSVKV